METPLQITYRHMESSPAVEADIRERVDALERFCGRIVSCRVVVEAPHHHHRKGSLFHVRIDLRLPHGEVVSSHDHQGAHAHEDIYVALRDAFHAARRQLEDEVRRLRGDVKAHEAASRGRIVRLFSWEHYGFIETTDGREVYFHQNAVLQGGFNQLEVGDEVRFDEQIAEGEKGPQASSVRLVRRAQAFTGTPG